MDDRIPYAIADELERGMVPYHETDVLLCFGCLLGLDEAEMVDQVLELPGSASFKRLNYRDKALQLLRRHKPRLDNLLSPYLPFSPDAQEEGQIWGQAVSLFRHLQDWGCLDTPDHKAQSFQGLVYALAETSPQLAEYTPPEDIAELVGFLVSRHGAESKNLSVLDPFCGTGTLLLQTLLAHLPGYPHLEGFTEDRKIADICAIWRFAIGDIQNTGKPADCQVRCGAPLGGPEGFDLAVSCIPFGQRREPQHLRDMMKFTRPGGTVIAVIPNGVLFRTGKDAQLREEWIKNNQLDTLLYLPENLLYNTRIPVSIVVLKKRREPDAPVRLIDLSHGELAGKKRSRLSRRLLDAAYAGIFEEEPKGPRYKLVTQAKLQSSGWALNRDRYFPQTVSSAAQDRPQISLAHIRELEEELKITQEQLEPYYQLLDGGEPEGG